MGHSSGSQKSDGQTGHFADRLAAAVQRVGTPVMVGLDPRWEQLPQALKEHAMPGYQQQADAYRRFCQGVIDVVANLVAVVKPQAAFFEQLGPAGTSALKEVIDYAVARNLLVVIDGKRNDIGPTAAAYAEGYLGRTSAWGGDALTVNPYLGDDSLAPFVDTARRRGAGLFVLVKTSNPGGKTFQDVSADGRPLYRLVASHVEGLASQTRGACGYGFVGAVVGATYPQELVELRAAMPSTWFLVPGYGSQGAGAKDVAAALDRQGLGAVINNSRGLIFAHARKEYAQYGDKRWQEAVAVATRDMIAELRAAAPAARAGQ